MANNPEEAKRVFLEHVLKGYGLQAYQKNFFDAIMRLSRENVKTSFKWASGNRLRNTNAIRLTPGNIEVVNYKTAENIKEYRDKTPRYVVDDLAAFWPVMSPPREKALNVAVRSTLVSRGSGP